MAPTTEEPEVAEPTLQDRHDALRVVRKDYLACEDLGLRLKLMRERIALLRDLARICHAPVPEVPEEVMVIEAPPPKPRKNILKTIDLADVAGLLADVPATEDEAEATPEEPATAPKPPAKRAGKAKAGKMRVDPDAAMSALANEMAALDAPGASTPQEADAAAQDAVPEIAPSPKPAKAKGRTGRTRPDQGH